MMETWIEGAETRILINIDIAQVCFFSQSSLKSQWMETIKEYKRGINSRGDTDILLPSYNIYYVANHNAFLSELSDARLSCRAH